MVGVFLVTLQSQVHGLCYKASQSQTFAVPVLWSDLQPPYNQCLQKEVELLYQRELLDHQSRSFVLF